MRLGDDPGITQDDVVPTERSPLDGRTALECAQGSRVSNGSSSWVLTIPTKRVGLTVLDSKPSKGPLKARLPDPSGVVVAQCEALLS